MTYFTKTTIYGSLVALAMITFSQEGNCAFDCIKKCKTLEDPTKPYKVSVDGKIVEGKKFGLWDCTIGCRDDDFKKAVNQMFDTLAKPKGS